MKRLFLSLLFITCSACWGIIFASEEYKEDMDSLLHKVKGHRQGVVVVNDEGADMKIYLSTSVKAPNGKVYYRWWEGNFLYSIHEPEEFESPTTEPMPYGYRYDEEKMYVYNFLTDEETMAYDFTLQTGELFTAPDGVTWEVVDRRTEAFKSDIGQQITDFKKELVVLSLRSQDGTMTDEWVQYIGSLHFPIQTWGKKDVKLSRTAFFNFGDNDDKLVYFDFAEDPLYGQLVAVEGGPNANTELTRNYSITAGESSLSIDINYYTWFTRHYCYSFRKGNTLDIQSLELGPYLDGVQGSPSFNLYIPATSGVKIDNIIYNKEVLTAIHDTPVQQIVNGKSLNGKCYDLSGRRINNSPLPRGIYIKDGRKTAVK